MTSDRPPVPDLRAHSPDLASSLLLRVVEPVTAALAACRFEDCPYLGSGAALSSHERAEHSRCHQCGSDPVGTLPVVHMSYCQRNTQTGGRM